MCTELAVCCAPRPEECNGLDDDCDGTADEGTRDATGSACCLPVPSAARTLSILFVIDNGGLVSPEQYDLVEQLPWLLGALGTGDIDDDGEPELEPLDEIRLGMVSTDMGTAGFRVPTCPEPDFGDDGVLRTEGMSMRADCAESYPTIAVYHPGETAPDDAAQQVDCLIHTGDDDGCGFEQPLEAALKAITPSTSDIRFFRDTDGHADRENAGFFDGAGGLAIIVLDDEDDRSFADPEVFDESSTRYTGNLNLRPFVYPEAFHPIDRYVDGFVSAAGASARVAFTVIGGIPPAVTPRRDVPGYDAILSDPDMQEQIDASDPNRLRPSCNVPGIGLAFPPTRLVQVARGLAERGAATAVGSNCQTDLQPALRAMLESMAVRAGAREECISGR